MISPSIATEIFYDSPKNMKNYSRIKTNLEKNENDFKETALPHFINPPNNFKIKYTYLHNFQNMSSSSISSERPFNITTSNNSNLSCNHKFNQYNGGNISELRYGPNIITHHHNGIPYSQHIKYSSKESFYHINNTVYGSSSNAPLFWPTRSTPTASLSEIESKTENFNIKQKDFSLHNDHKSSPTKDSIYLVPSNRQGASQYNQQNSKNSRIQPTVQASQYPLQFSNTKEKHLKSTSLSKLSSFYHISPSVQNKVDKSYLINKQKSFYVHSSNTNDKSDSFEISPIDQTIDNQNKEDTNIYHQSTQRSKVHPQLSHFSNLYSPHRSQKLKPLPSLQKDSNSSISSTSYRNYANNNITESALQKKISLYNHTTQDLSPHYKNSKVASHLNKNYNLIYDNSSKLKDSNYFKPDLISDSNTRTSATEDYSLNKSNSSNKVVSSFSSDIRHINENSSNSKFQIEKFHLASFKKNEILRSTHKEYHPNYPVYPNPKQPENISSNLLAPHTNEKIIKNSRSNNYLYSQQKKSYENSLYLNNNYRYLRNSLTKTRLIRGNYLTRLQNQNPFMWEPLTEKLLFNILNSSNKNFYFTMPNELKEFETLRSEERILGQGAYGIVIKVRYINKRKLLNTDHFFAIKIMTKDHFICRGLGNQLIREIKSHTSCNHPNILPCYAYYETKYHSFLLLEGMKQTLQHFASHLNEQQICKFVKQIISATLYLHENKIIHRDIKLDNILWNTDNIVKLSDFGWCADISNGYPNDVSGSFHYMAPEILIGAVQTPKVDIWSIGCCTYELFTGQSLFNIQDPPPEITNISLNEWNKIEMIRQHNSNYIENLNNFLCKHNISENAISFISESLSYKPEKRLDAKMALSHPWIKSLSSDFFLSISSNKNFEIEYNRNSALSESIC